MTWRIATCAILAWLLAIAPAPRAAVADTVAQGGRIAVSWPGRDVGPLVLAPGPGALVGAFTIRNVGTEPLAISRVSIRGDEDDARSPGRLSVRFDDGAATSATIAPGGSKEGTVSWMPEADPRVRQAFGHVLVTSSDEGAGEVAIGFRAQLPTSLGRFGEHALSFLVVWPLVPVLAIFAARLGGRRDPQRSRSLFVAGGVIELFVAFWAYRRFAPDVSRIDGNDGYQLIERFVWVRSVGTEWFVGVDGTSMPLVLLAAVVGLVGLIAAAPERRSDEYYAAVALLSTGVMGVLVALDLVVLFAAWQMVWFALVLLVGGWGGARSRLVSAKLALYAVVGSGAMFLAFVALSRASGSCFLVDGTRIAHTMSIPELARTSFAAKGSILGLSFVEAAWMLLFVAVAVATPIVPLHGWLPDVLEQSPVGVAVVVAGVVLTLGPYLLVRIGLGAVPEGARWAGASVAALGAFGAAWSALCAMVQRDFRRFLAYAAISGAGVTLCGIGSLTPEGIAGGGLLLFAHGIASALLLGVAAALEQRFGSSDAARARGLFAAAPVLAGLSAIALGVSAGLPGLAGSWGVLLTMLGGFVRYPLLSLLLAIALIVSIAAHLRFGRNLLFGSGAATVVDATAPEMAVLVPLAALALFLGLWPTPLLSSILVAARDCSALVDPTGPDLRIDVR